MLEVFAVMKKLDFRPELDLPCSGMEKDNRGQEDSSALPAPWSFVSKPILGFVRRPGPGI